MMKESSARLYENQAALASKIMHFLRNKNILIKSTFYLPDISAAFNARKFWTSGFRVNI